MDKVSWKDNKEKEIKNGMEGYTISPGLVDKNRVQETTLIIAPDILAMVEGSTGNDTIYKCAVEPTKFLSSPGSMDKDLYVTFVPPSKCLIKSKLD